MLVINVNTGMLNTILSQEAFDTIIVDSSNNIVAANRPELYGKTLAEIEDASGSFTTRAAATSRSSMTKPPRC